MRRIALLVSLALAAVLVPAAGSLAAPSGQAAALRSTYFMSPTANIHCKYRARSNEVSCKTLNNGRIVGLRAFGRAYLKFGGYYPSGSVLPYGRTWRRGSFSCLSTFYYMQCRSVRSGRGFRIHRSGWSRI